MIAVVAATRTRCPERRQSRSALPWESTAAKNGASFVRQEHGQRPAAAALGEHLLRDLVDAVDVGALFGSL